MKRKQTAAAAAAVLLALSSPLLVLAGPSGADGGVNEAYLAELNDGTLQYSELPGLVERYNVTYKNTYAQIAGTEPESGSSQTAGKGRRRSDGKRAGSERGRYGRIHQSAL